MKTAKDGHIRQFDPFRVRPLPDQPRKRFRGIPELAASIKEVGQANPGLVTLICPDDFDGADFDAQLIDGERRLRACQSIKKIIADRRKCGESEVELRGGRSRQTALRSLDSAVAGLRDRLGIFVDMPPAELKDTIACADRRLAELLIEKIQAAEEELCGLREVIEKELE